MLKALKSTLKRDREEMKAMSNRTIKTLLVLIMFFG